MRDPQQHSLKSRYERGSSARNPFLERARKCAELTIPTLYPMAGSTSSTAFKTPYQSLGARGVNHLAAKLLLTLMPPNAPFFKLIMDDTLKAEIAQEASKGAIDEAMSRAERAIMREIETSAIRIQTFEAIKHLLVSGNTLVCWPDPVYGKMRVYPLDRYICHRDFEGNVTEIIIRETVSPLMLPDRAKHLVDGEGEKSDDPDREIDLYTCVLMQKDKSWRVHQEVNDQMVPGSEGRYPEGKTLPWLPLKFESIDGEDYGRGHCEAYYGDLKSLETLTQAIVEGSAAAAKVLFLVNPNGFTNEVDLAETPNGGIIAGNAQDVSVLQLDKFNDFKIAEVTIQKISERLSYAFLLNSAIRRDAERVTAEEIRWMAQELESSLGGVFSLLSASFQFPLVRIILEKLETKGELPAMPEDSIRPQIVTGLEGLGRSDDLNRLTEFLNDIQMLAQAQGVQAEMNTGEVIRRVGAARGIEMANLLKTDEQKQQEAEQAEKQMKEERFHELLKSASPEIIKQYGSQMMGEGEGGAGGGGSPPAGQLPS